MRRVFLVDYKENGVDRHQVIEMLTALDIGLMQTISLIRWKIGMQCEISCIVEFFTDLPFSEIEKISKSPGIVCIKRDLIYINPAIALV